MLFNSYIFILAFLPLVILLYFGVNRFGKYILGNWLLILASIVFLGYHSVEGALIFVASLLVNYGMNFLIKKCQGKSQKSMLAIGIVVNVLFLGFYKYANLFGGNVIMPLGISFYTFQQIAYLVDNYRGEVKACSFTEYMLFVSYFPKLVQGPIAYHDELIPQFRDESKKHFDFNQFSRGIALFALGLGKKVLLADSFGKIVDYGYSSIHALNSFEAMLTILGYALQLYLDFSGYCDMAMGVSGMLNIELPWNFNSPYKARNISEFWKCWHMTLTRFLTKYIYIPLGGNRKGVLRTYINIIIVYLVSGLWHGVGLTFIVWGLMHGLATVLYRMFKKQFDKIPGVIQWGMTFAFVNMTWVFFRAASVEDALRLIKRVLTGGFQFKIGPELEEILVKSALSGIPSALLPLEIVVLGAMVLAVLSCVFMKNCVERIKSFKPNFGWLFVTYILLVLSVLSLSGVTSFLYTNF